MIAVYKSISTILAILLLATIASAQPLPPNPGTGNPPITHTDATFRNLGSSVLVPGQCITVGVGPNFYLQSTGSACGSGGGGGGGVQSVQQGNGITVSGTAQNPIVSLTIPVTSGNGGTGLSSPTAHSLLIAEGSSPFSLLACDTGQALFGSTGADPTCRTISSSDLPNSGVVAGSYTLTNLTVNAQGLITAASNGSGVVSSVGLTMPTGFSVAGSPVTSSGTLAVTFANENANTVLAGPATGAATTPTFRALQVVDVPGNTIAVTNEGVTGTTVNKLASFTSASPNTAIISTAGALTGIKGVCAAGCGTTGTALIQQSGVGACVFDGQTVAGDYVQLSASVNGDCTDGGGTYPTLGEVLGVVRTTNAVPGTYNVDFFSPDVQQQTGGGGSGNQLAQWLVPNRVTTAGATLSVNLNKSGNQFISLHDTITLSFSNPPPHDGWVVRFKLTQTNSGSHTVTWPGTVQWPNASAPTLTTTNGQADIVNCLYDATTTNYACSPVLNFVP